MELLNSILYDTVYHSAPIILCVIGGIFAYKANVLNIALEGMMLNGAFVSVLVEYMTGSVAVVDYRCNCDNITLGTSVFDFRDQLQRKCHRNRSWN